VEFSKSEQRYLSRFIKFKRPPLWRSVLQGILIFVAIQVSGVYLDVAARVIVLIAIYALLFCWLVWERYVAGGVILKLRERINELEITSGRGAD
jgi:hypothetical protein